MEERPRQFCSGNRATTLARTHKRNAVTEPTVPGDEKDHLLSARTTATTHIKTPPSQHTTGSHTVANDNATRSDWSQRCTT
jgi:hypothetical protein